MPKLNDQPVNDFRAYLGRLLEDADWKAEAITYNFFYYEQIRPSKTVSVVQMSDAIGLMEEWVDVAKKEMAKSRIGAAFASAFLSNRDLEGIEVNFKWVEESIHPLEVEGPHVSFKFSWVEQPVKSAEELKMAGSDLQRMLGECRAEIHELLFPEGDSGRLEIRASDMEGIAPAERKSGKAAFELLISARLAEIDGERRKALEAPKAA